MLIPQLWALIRFPCAWRANTWAC